MLHTVPYDVSSQTTILMYIHDLRVCMPWNWCICTYACCVATMSVCVVLTQGSRSVACVHLKSRGYTSSVRVYVCVHVYVSLHAWSLTCVLMKRNRWCMLTCTKTETHTHGSTAACCHLDMVCAAQNVCTSNIQWTKLGKLMYQNNAATAVWNKHM